MLVYLKVEGSLTPSGVSFQTPVALLVGSQASLMNRLTGHLAPGRMWQETSEHSLLETIPWQQSFRKLVPRQGPHLITP